MNVLIIGGGAIGCMLSARIAAGEHQVTLVERSEAAHTIRARGVRLVEANGRELLQPIDVVASPTDAFSTRTRFDLAVVAVKAYDTAALAADLRAGWPGDLPLLSIQNGIGNEEAFASALSAPVLAGALTTPVESLAPGHVRIARPSHKFAVAPGPGAVDARSVAHLFQQAGFTTQIFADWRAVKWCKLLMNILANAQAAILGLTPARIFAEPALGSLEVAAWREAMAVMQTEGISPVPLAGYPLPLIVPLVRRLPAAWVRPVLGRFISGGRGSKMPSLTYDVAPTPRGRSEVAWLNGAVAAAARSLGLRAPVNETLTRVLLDLVEGRTPPSAWSGQAQKLVDEVAHWREK